MDVPKGQYETEPIKMSWLMVGQRMKPQDNLSFRLKTICLVQKNSEKNVCFPWKNWFFLTSVKKTLRRTFSQKKKNVFSSGNKSLPQSFSVPGIMFPPRRNIYSHLIYFRIDRSIKVILQIHGCMNNWY